MKVKVTGQGKFGCCVVLGNPSVPQPPIAMAFSSIFNFFVNLVCGSPPPPPPPRPPRPQQAHLPSQHFEPPSRPHKLSPHHGGSDLNQINQSNEYYVNLRARANEEGDGMARAFEQSHQAYASGDRAGAKTLSNEGKEHQRKMEAYNKEASNWIFLGNKLAFGAMNQR